MSDDHDIKWMEQDVDRRARGHYTLGLGWLKRDRVQRALDSFEVAIKIEPMYVEPYLKIASLYLQLRRWHDLREHCLRVMARFSALSEFHKLLITAIEEIDSLDAAYSHYDLRRRDGRECNVADGEILCCVTVRDEYPRLPYFLDYYRKLGVDRFLVVDNGSTDGGIDYLLQQPDVHLWCSSRTFRDANFGSSWFELLLRRYGVGHWCVTVDTDEFLVYRGVPDKNLKALCRELDAAGIEAITGQLLDMYSDGPVREARYRPGQNPLEICPFFDRQAYSRRYEMGGQYRNQRILFGGPRQRVFPAEHDYLLSKVAMLRYQPRVVLAGGQHLTNIPADKLAQNRMALLHFKFLASMPGYASREAKRAVHAMSGEQYKAYHARFEQNPALTLYDPALSVRFEGVDQLETLGILDPPTTDKPVPVFPVVAAAATNDSERPFWSVMITVYKRTAGLRRAISSVLAQSSEDMQVEVICDGIDTPLQAEIRQLVSDLGDGRASFHAAGAHLGHPHIFNLAIDRARGRWVHILHDDDWVEPGFYAALRTQIEATPQAGAAFTQHRIVERSGSDETVWNSWLEANRPGIVQHWLPRIVTECRVQFSAMTIKREAFERLGGFCPQALSTLDWEMWKRIAAHYPVIFVPEILANIGRDASAESSRLIRTGEQVLHGLATVDITSGYLPAGEAPALAGKAREQLALYALDVSRRYFALGDTEAALANLRAAARCSDSARVRRALAQVLLGRNDEFDA